MQVDDIKHKELTPSEYEVLSRDKERWQRMGAGGHLDDWLAYRPGLMIRRRLAMRMAFTNKPEGKGYAQAFAGADEGRWSPHHGQDQHHRSAVAGR